MENYAPFGLGMATLEAMSQSMYGRSFIGQMSEELIKMPVSKKRNYTTGKPRKKAQGRNERCNCGSGLKYKYCCGR
jgi:uncharacterized protein YchJ